ncbi:transporter associated domain-containing protein [soil metagenome]
MSTLKHEGTDNKIRGERKAGLFERLSSLLMREPEDREQLLDVLHAAHERALVDDDALSMMEGALKVGELSAREIMVPRPQMDMIDVAEPLDRIVPFVIETAHSRFPVYEHERDNVIGVLLAKDLLGYYHSDSFDVRSILRPAVFIPEAKRVNILLRDFRSNRNHLAMVVDEYGGIAGLVTIEDVLEQIVGDIEDEHDDEHAEDAAFVAAGIGKWRVLALAELEEFNDRFGTTFEPDGFETVGGLVTDRFGRVPKRGEKLEIGPIRFEVLRADARQVHLLLAERATEAA